MEAAVTGGWNPHWVAFARSRGCDPGELGCEFNVEFVCWISARLGEYRKETGVGDRLDADELDGFSRFLAGWADVHGPGEKESAA